MRYRLHWSPTSPYVRKVMVAAHELGLADRFDLVPTRPDTVVADVAADNPLGRVPALVLPDGTTLFDSVVIVEFLDHAAGGRLFPPAGPHRWQSLTLHALGQGVIDAAIAIVAEGRRAAAERSPSFLDARREEIGRGLDALEKAPPSDAADIGTIAVGVGLGYIDFRLPDLPWRRSRPGLARWFEAFEARPSMQATRPPAGAHGG
jgi:glutathione S-transferase